MSVLEIILYSILGAITVTYIIVMVVRTILKKKGKIKKKEDLEY